MGYFQFWNLKEHSAEYEKYIQRCKEVSAYHYTEYLHAEEKAENGNTKIFVYEENGHFALCPLVVRKINDISYMADMEEELYDAIAPHEYSGIISDSSEPSIKEGLLKGIERYCETNDIIFLFTRLNPYMKDLPELLVKSNYEVIHSNSQTYVNLKCTEEDIFCGYKANVRRNIRRAQREGLVFEMAEKSRENIVLFKIMYQKAMDILGARSFLYFNDEYFKSLIACECIRMGFVRTDTGKVIAAGILLMDERIAYYHLGCFDRDYSLKRPMNFLIHSMMMWSKENGREIFHLGGGGESLRQFKEGYSEARIDYYIADKVFDQEKYKYVCDIWKTKFPQHVEKIFYPLYRYNES